MTDLDLVAQGLDERAKGPGGVLVWWVRVRV